MTEARAPARSAGFSIGMTVAVAIGLAILVGLGVWQLQRLKWKEGLLWGKRFSAELHRGAPATATEPAPTPIPSVGAEERSMIPAAASGPAGLAATGTTGHGHDAPAEAPRNVQLFFSVYFAMTGLHGLHVIAGMAVLGWILRRSIRGEFGPDYFIPVDLAGLYWHLVDLIWIYLFPLLYLIH
jgi:cytochrome c oxidase subunit 3